MCPLQPCLFRHIANEELLRQCRHIQSGETIHKTLSQTLEMTESTQNTQWLLSLVVGAFDYVH